MTTERVNRAVAQPTDPPWARLAFVVLEGRDGQWWRAILLVTPLLVVPLVVTSVLAVLLGVMATSGVWVGGAFGVGSVTTALALSRRAGRPLTRR